MHIYTRLNINIQNKIDNHIKKNNKILQNKLIMKLLSIFLKKILTLF